MTDPDVTALVARALDIQSSVSIDDDMSTLAAWTSLTHVRLILELETALSRPLTPAEIASIDSVRAIAKILSA